VVAEHDAVGLVVVGRLVRDDRGAVVGHRFGLDLRGARGSVDRLDDRDPGGGRRVRQARRRAVAHQEQPGARVAQAGEQGRSRLPGVQRHRDGAGAEDAVQRDRVPGGVGHGERDTVAGRHPLGAELVTELAGRREQVAVADVRPAEADRGPFRVLGHRRPQRGDEVRHAWWSSLDRDGRLG
jgi:hypothetical protein